MAFNPDTYLASKQSGFDPDAYLASKNHDPQGIEQATTAMVETGALSQPVESKPKLSLPERRVKTPSNFDVARNAVVKGVASVPDSILNTPTNIYNLGKAAIGTGLTAMGRSDLAPDLTENPSPVSRGLTAIGSIREEDEPVTSGQRMLDAAVQGGTGMLLTGKPTLTGTGIGALSGAVGQGVGEATGSDLAGTAAAVLTGGIAARGAGLAQQKAAGKQAIKEVIPSAEKSRNAVFDSNMADARKAGYVVSPGMVKPSRFGIKESIAGKLETEAEASNRNAVVTHNLAAKAIGLPENTPITRETLQQVRNEHGKSYQKIKELPPLKIDKDYKPSDLSPEIDQSLGLDAAYKYELPSAKVVESISQLRSDGKGYIEAARRSGDPAQKKMGKAYLAEAKQLEGLIERNLEASGNKQLLADFRNSRKEIAKTYAIEDALVEGTGTIDAAKLARSAQKGDLLTGELKTIGQFANVQKRVNKPASQIGAKNAGQLKAYGAAGLSGLGAAGLGPVGAVIGAAAPYVVPPMMRNYLLSERFQNKLSPNYDAGKSYLAQMEAPDVGRAMLIPAIQQSNNSLERRK